MKYWIIIRCNSEDQPKMFKTRKGIYRQHETLEAAMSELNRLIKENPGKMFAVFELIVANRTLVDKKDKKDIV